MNFDKLVKRDWFDLHGRAFNDDDIDVHIKAIEQSTVLEMLYLNNNKLTLVDGKLITAIANNTTLKFLQLEGNDIGLDEIKHLADVLKTNNTLEELNLSKNNISDEGAKYIADMLAVNKTLQVISLYDNNIGPRGAKHLANALKGNNTLNELQLFRNDNIGDEGAKYIADMLTVNKTLQRIGLSRNNIGDEGAESIAACLTINTSLQRVYLQYNNITDEGAEKLLAAQESNYSIKRTLHLLLDNDNISNLDQIKKKVQQDHWRKILTATNKENAKRKKHDELEEENKRLKNELADAQKMAVTVRQVREQLNSVRKEKEEALKLVASMKADIKKKEEEIEKKEHEIKSRDRNIANKDQQLKSALDGIAEREQDIEKKNKQLLKLESIKKILNPAADDDNEPATKRARTSTSDTSMEVWDKDTPHMMTRHQNQMKQASEKPIIKLENKVEGFKRCPFPECNTIGLFTKGCSIVTCRMNMRHNGKFHHFCFYCGKSASDPGDSCNNGVCPYKIDEESRKLYQDNLDKAFMEFSRQTRQAGGAYDVDKV